MSGNLARRGQTQVYARRLQADRGAPAAAQGHVRRVAGAHHLLRVLGARFAVRQPSQPRDQRDLAPAGDAGGAGAAQGLDQERARPRDSGLHERARPRVRMGRRRRHRPAAAGADPQHPGDGWDQDARGSARRPGTGGWGGKPPGAPTALGKFNPNHDEQGRFTTADNAVDPGSTSGSSSKPSGALVAGLDNVATDAIVEGGTANEAALQTAENAQAPASVRPTAQTDAVPLPVQQARDRIVAAAEKYVGSTAWSNDVSMVRTESARTNATSLCIMC